MRRVLLAGLPGLLLCTAAPAGAAAADCKAAHWVAGWTASPSDRADAGFTQQTLRLILTPHLGGNVMRLHFSNRFGRSPLTLARVSIGLRSSGASLAAGSLRPVTFNGGSPAAVAAPGADVVSDPVSLNFSAFQDLAVNVFLAGSSGPVTEHFTARQTSYESAAGSGDQTGNPGGGGFSALPNTTRPLLDGLDVQAAAGASTVAAFGDSITDGYQGRVSPVTENAAGLDANGRYPDDLARRLLRAGSPVSVVNAGISGNRVLLDGQIPPFGPSGLSRVGADVLGLSGVSDAIVLEGINDIGQTPATAPALEAGLLQLVAKLHAGHLNVLLGTLTPAGGTLVPTYGSASADAVRQAVNAWIRSGASHADAVVDFDAAVRDASDPSRIAAPYDGSDHLHFSLAGYQAMANAVPLGSLRGLGCAAGTGTQGGRPGAGGRGGAGNVHHDIVCVSRRRFLVHVPRRYRGRLRRADIYLNGRHVATVRRVGHGTAVDLRRLPGGVARVRLQIRLRSGLLVVQSRRYRTCVRRRRPRPGSPPRTR